MKKIPIWKNIVLIFSALVVVVIAAFAWFYLGPLATIERLTVHVGKATYIQVSGDNGDNWTGDLDMEIGLNKNFKEISGDGKVFFAPEYEVLENPEGGFSPQLIAFDRVGENQFYYEQTLDFRADTVQNVSLAPESVVSAVGNGNNYIDGAIRVAFYELDENGNENLKFIWAPNSTVEYSAGTNSFTREGSVEPYYYYQKSLIPVDVNTLEETTSNVAIISTENTDENGCGYNEEYQFMWSNGENLPADMPLLLTVDSLGEDDLYYKSIKVRVWLEGHDRECVSLLHGQRFTMKLQFAAQEVE